MKVLKRVNRMLVEGEKVVKELRNTSQNFSEVSLAFGCLSVSVHGSTWDVTGVLEDTYRITRQLIHKRLNERCCKKVRFH